MSLFRYVATKRRHADYAISATPILRFDASLFFADMRYFSPLLMLIRVDISDDHIADALLQRECGG